MYCIVGSGIFAPPKTNEPIPQSRWSLKSNSGDSDIVNILLHVMSFKYICTYNVRCRYTVHGWERLRRTMLISFQCAVYTEHVLCMWSVHCVCLVQRCEHIQLNLRGETLNAKKRILRMYCACATYTADVLYNRAYADFVQCTCTVFPWMHSKSTFNLHSALRSALSAYNAHLQYSFCIYRVWCTCTVQWPCAVSLWVLL